MSSSRFSATVVTKFIAESKLHKQTIRTLFPKNMFKGLTVVQGSFLGIILFSLFFVPSATALDDINVNQTGKSLVPLPIVLSEPKPYPVLKNQTTSLKLSAYAVVAADYETNTILFSQNPNIQLAPASLIKLLTALVVLDHCHPNQVLSTAMPVPLFPDESKMGLLVGETMTVENLLYGMLLPSGNDAAQTLAQGCGVEGIPFTNLMNDKAKALGMMHTNASNVFGRDEAGNVTTAHDMLLLSRAVMKVPLLKKIVNTSYKEVTDTTNTFRHPLVSTNIFVRNGKAIGIKTGTTDEAKQNLVVLLNGPEDRKMYVVLLGSFSRFAEAQSVMDWVLQSHQWTLPGPSIDHFAAQLEVLTDLR